MINNYEEEIVHDILYSARGKGYVTETEIFNLAYPMIMGFRRNENSPFYHSELNFLQSYQIFDSLKRLVLLEKMRVVADKESKENTILVYMYTAQKIKTEEIVIKEKDASPHFCRNSFRSRYKVNYENLIHRLYGITDGVIKARSDLCHADMIFTNICSVECSELDRINHLMISR